jgi:hypothetical protein
MQDENYYQSLDKRTKEYKDWVASREADTSGLGDVIESITEATGIKAAVKFIAGEDCGCDERKEKLNKLFPRSKPQCLTEEEYNYLVEEMTSGRNQISQITQLKMLKIYNRIFATNKRPTSCGSCFRATYDALRKIVNEYN